MMKLKLHLIFLTYVFYLFTFTKAEENTKLLFVQILFRHGDRSPVALYPNDPNPASFWLEGLGKLTILGRKQHYALGKYLYARYQNFITSSPLEVNVSSSGIDRCIKSAQTNVAAFFVPDAQWSFEDKLKWQPLPVYYLPTNVDRYLETGSDCPRAFEEQKRVLNSPEGQKFITEHKEMFGNLTYYSGETISDWTSAHNLQDVLMIEKKYNLTFPSWVEPLWDELSEVSDLSFYWTFNSPLLHRLRAGPLLQRMIENMQKKINGDTPDLKVQIFSAHDTNIAAVLSALNLFNMKEPPYCAMLLFELHENKDGAKVIRLLYQNSSNPETEIQDPHVLVLDGCSEFCPLAYFINYTQSLIPEDWDKECQLDKSFVDKIREEQVTIGWFFILVAVVIVTMSIYTLWRIYSRRQDKYAYHLMPMN